MFEESADSLRKYGSVGVLNSLVFSGWTKLVIEWFETRGSDWRRDPLVVPILMLAWPVVTAWNYLSYRLFENPGEWSTVFVEFSGSNLLSASIVAGFGVFFVAGMELMVEQVRRGEHPILLGKEAPRELWKVLLILLGIPGFLFCVLLLNRVVRAFTG